MASSTVGSQLANTAELIEMMLLHLPLPDILLAHRVSRAWQQVIKDSPKLQKALFFRPASEQTLIVTHTPLWTCDCTNHSECRRVLPASKKGPFQGHGTPRWVHDDKDQKRTRRPVLNPFALVPFPNLLMGLYLAMNNIEWRRCPINERQAAALARPEASWRRMLLSQPAPRELMVQHGFPAYHHHRLAQGSAIGVTLADTSLR